MSPPRHTLFTFHTKVRTVRLSFRQLVIQAHAMQLAVKETKLYENLTYGPHVARGYRVKLQR